MKPFKLLFLLLVLPIIVSAQNLEGGVFLGGSDYGGDVVVPDFFGFQNTNFAYGLMIRNSFNPKLALRGNLLFGKIEGNDADYDDPAWRKQRAFSFQSSLTEISLQLEWSPLAKDWYEGDDDNPAYDDNGNRVFRKSWSPYIFAGIGGVFVDPETNLDERMNAGGSMQNKIQEDMDAEYTNFHVAFPLGLGVKFDLSPKAVLGFEVGVRPPISDYLDGISVAANPDKNDWYGFGGLTLSFRLGDNNVKKDAVMETKVMDADADGVPDERDLCPTVAGKAMFSGCPDSDDDGIADKDDACPTISGSLNGCPDGDNDGIADKDDRCPTEKGIASEGGCPKKEVDSDGDGVLDAIDKCPNTAGLSNFGGCPDSDGDGIIDRDDRCPNERGIATEGGCPRRVVVVDTDGDGVEDSRDRCPTSAGSASNNGCPMISSADRATLDMAIRNIRFETSKNVLKSESYNTMDQIVDIMNRYPNYSLRISGHTDSVGDSSSNQRLSERRAKACYDYLARKGVTSSRMSHSGYGESRPIASNDASDGRRMNRRVEFELFLR